MPARRTVSARRSATRTERAAAGQDREGGGHRVRAGSARTIPRRRRGNQIGTGSVSTSFFEDADPAPTNGTATSRSRVRCRASPRSSTSRSPTCRRGGRFATRPTRRGGSALVDTQVQVEALPACNPPNLGGDTVGTWQAVRQFWANGIASLCGAGLVVADVERPCRQRGFGSEAVVLVTRADDPSVVIEDGDGIQVELAELRGRYRGDRSRRDRSPLRLTGRRSVGVSSPRTPGGVVAGEHPVADLVPFVIGQSAADDVARGAVGSRSSRQR